MRFGIWVSGTYISNYSTVDVCSYRSECATNWCNLAQSVTKISISVLYAVARPDRYRSACAVVQCAAQNGGLYLFSDWNQWINSSFPCTIRHSNPANNFSIPWMPQILDPFWIIQWKIWYAQFSNTMWLCQTMWVVTHKTVQTKP